MGGMIYLRQGVLSLPTLYNRVSFPSSSVATPTPAPTLYFTNQSNIDKLQNNVATTVIQAGTSPLALDYNSCDNRIYWTSNTEIKRSFPNNSKIEQVKIKISLSINSYILYSIGAKC